MDSAVVLFKYIMAGLGPHPLLSALDCNGFFYLRCMISKVVLVQPKIFLCNSNVLESYFYS